MKSCDIHHRLLTASGMREARRALIEKCNSFTHTTSVSNLTSIRKFGLKPNHNGEIYFPQIISSVTRGPPFEIVCLRPDTSKTSMVISKDPPLCKLAVAASDAPAQMVIDWTMMPAWKMAGCLSAGGQDDTSVFVEVALRYGTVASLDPVAADVLRACPRSNPTLDPANWPFLRNIADDDVYQF